MKNELPRPAGPAGNPEPLTPDLLFRRYARYVGAIGLRLLGQRDQANDLVQDVFVLVVRALPALEDPATVRTWIGRIAVRLAIRRLRRRRLLKFLHLEDESVYGHLAATGVDPEQRALLDRVYVTLDGLPVDERVAWTLRHIEGEQMEDVARLCGWSLSTTKRRVNAAHGKIQEKVVGP